VPRQTPPMEPVEITAGRLHLRPWQAGDEAAVLEACTDPETLRWTNVPEGYTAEQAREYVTVVAPAGWQSGTDLCFAVCDSTTGQVLADVTLRPRQAPGVWDVGYWCMPAARGQGVVTEALGALCRWGFGALGARRIEWQAQLGNWGSRRVAEKTGFRVEGVLRHGMPHRGELVDGWLGALLPDDPAVDTAAFPPYPDRTDGVVTVRRWRVADAPEVQRACADEQTARWLPVPVPYTLEVAQGYVGAIVPTEWFGGTAANCAVVDAADGSLLGAVGLTLRGGIGEVGYWTAPWARGRGVAGRAARLHAGWGFEALGLPRVELLADVENVASQRVAEKSGWTREGVAWAVRPAPRDPSRRVDMVVYARLPQDV
jgi:RimJ/RimL family protein N-acetyltransferase